MVESDSAGEIEKFKKMMKDLFLKQFRMSPES